MKQIFSIPKVVMPDCQGCLHLCKINGITYKCGALNYDTETLSCFEPRAEIVEESNANGIVVLHDVYPC